MSLNVFFDFPSPQVDSVTPSNTIPPPVARLSLTPILAPASLDDTMIPLAVGSHSHTPATASATASVPVPTPVLPIEPTPAPTPAIQVPDSQNVPATQNDTQPVTATTTNSTAPPSCTTETAAIATTLESPAGPSTSVLGPTGNSDTQIDSQDTLDVPSMPNVARMTPMKAPAKRAKAQASKKITAK